MYIHICIHVCVYVYIYIYICICMYSYIYEYIQVVLILNGFRIKSPEEKDPRMKHNGCFSEWVLFLWALRLGTDPKRGNPPQGGGCSFDQFRVIVGGGTVDTVLPCPK